MPLYLIIQYIPSICVLLHLETLIKVLWGFLDGFVMHSMILAKLMVINDGIPISGVRRRHCVRARDNLL